MDSYFAKKAKRLIERNSAQYMPAKRGGYQTMSSFSHLCTSFHSNFQPQDHKNSQDHKDAQDHKRLVAFLLILCLAVGAVFASTTQASSPNALATQTAQVHWAWHCNDPVNYFRYRLEGQEAENWTVVDSSITNVQLQAQSGDVLYVQSSYDGRTWSTSGSCAYSHGKTYGSAPQQADLALRLSIAPNVIAVTDFYNGHDTASAKTRTTADCGMTTGLELDWNLASFLRIWPEASYTLAVRSQNLIPGTQMFHYFKLGAGLEGLIHITKTDILCLGVFGGALASINNNLANITPYFGARLGYEKVLTENWTLCVTGRFSMSFYKASEALNDSYTIFFEPVTLGLSYGLGGKK